MLDPVKLVTLRTVVARGSFSRAAQELALTQPAVSRQVGLLEQHLGARLVRRTRQGVVPTEAGRALLAHVDLVLGQLDRAERDVRDLVALRQGVVRLGSFLSALVHLSAETAALLDRAHPGIRLVDELVDRPAALGRLRAGTLDLAFVFEHDFEPAPAVPGVELSPLFEDPVAVLLPAGHRLASGEVSLAELAEETWIRPHEGSAARRLDLVLGRAGLRPPLLLAGRGDEPFEAQALVAAGRGVALTHRLTVLVSDHELVVVPLRDRAGLRRVQVAVPEGPRRPAVAAALEAVLAVGGSRRRQSPGA
ncbi:LysR family transcriptional regulator [Blastococcus sp. SYSU D00922]